MNNAAPQSPIEMNSKNFLQAIDWKAIAERAASCITKPKSIWEEVRNEVASTKDLLLKYVLPLSCIAAIANFIGMALIGVEIGFIGKVRWPIFSGLVETIATVALQIAALYLFSVLLQKFSKFFGGELSENQAIKIVCYSSTPAIVASFFMIIPALGFYAAIPGFILTLVLFFNGITSYSGISGVGKKVLLFLSSAICTGICMLVLRLILSSFLPFASNSMASMTMNPELPDNIRQLEQGMGDMQKMLEGVQR